jgi:hypothetical protein
MMEQLLGGNPSISSPDTVLNQRDGNVDVPSATPGATPGAANEDELLMSLEREMGVTNMRDIDNIPDIASSFQSLSPPSPPGDASPAPSQARETSKVGSKEETRLTTEEALDLQNRIDSMSDEQLEKGVSLPPLLITTTISTTPMVMVMVIVIVTTMMSILTLTFSSVSFYSYTLLDYAILCLDHSTTHAVFAKMRTALGDKVQQTQADEMAQV